jgi:hypothetical protein
MTASLQYLANRKKYTRPQAMLWADNPGTIEDGNYIPFGYEIGSDSANDNFIILSDDNREQISFNPTRIEQRRRMVNGRMRAYHIADKVSISTSWQLLPARAFSSTPEFQSFSGDTIGKPINEVDAYTSDGGAGGVELYNWYTSHPGSFWVYLSYDRYDNYGKNEAAFNNINKYSEVVEVFFADFSYEVVKRGLYDFWNISVSLEEV